MEHIKFSLLFRYLCIPTLVLLNQELSPHVRDLGSRWLLKKEVPSFMNLED